MNIVTVGINHKTAPIESREKFFLTPLQQDLVLSEMKCNPSVFEAFILSTCNRTEVYAHVLEDFNLAGFFTALVSSIKKIPFHPDDRKLFYIYRQEQAIRHLLRVAAGLDSLVLGEKQILGQVRTSLERGQSRAMFSKNFNILANIAIRTGKKAQTETQISYGGSSVSWAAVMMAEQKLGTLAGRSFLIIGAGKMGELTINQIYGKGVSKVYVMNRTQCNAEALAEKCEGIPVSFCDIKETLAEVDVAICAVCAPHYILEKDIVQKVMEARKGRELILMDISMPRNIDPQTATVPGIHLSCIDDLQQVMNESMRKRQASVGAVEKIIEAKLSEFYEKLAKIQDIAGPAEEYLTSPDSA
ncbi:MAG: glutamyl-tRNA reductase [Candidatus Omnitrophota bacterium]|nr:glutamyl-tRNA reductase [Candidatus Omnitrophota bacterium]MDZ4243330.1 glutamyl-tRNA reductase [Candidatus Omnitrophota bacterium]